MTAQFGDAFRHKGIEYTLAGISTGELFDPSVLDLEPQSACTACWRGYVAAFGIIDSRLVLDGLLVNLGHEGPCINGVAPKPDDSPLPLFDNHYEGLGFHLEFSGGLLIAGGFIDELYEHMGFHPAWKYETVIELIFANGVLQQEHDRSEAAAVFRRRMDELVTDGVDGLPTRKEIEAYVRQAFDRTYFP